MGLRRLFLNRYYLINLQGFEWRIQHYLKDNFYLGKKTLEVSFEEILKDFCLDKLP